MAYLAAGMDGVRTTGLDVRAENVTATMARSSAPKKTIIYGFER